MKYGGQFNYIQLNRGYGAYEQANESLGKSNAANGLDNFVTDTAYQFQKALNPAARSHVQWGRIPALLDPGTPIITPACSLTYPLTDPSFNRSDRYNDWGLYAEDSWRITPRFTFNYGVNMSISASSTTTFEASIPISTTDRDPHTSSRCRTARYR